MSFPQIIKLNASMKTFTWHPKKLKIKLSKGKRKTAWPKFKTLEPQTRRKDLINNFNFKAAFFKKINKIKTKKLHQDKTILNVWNRRVLELEKQLHYKLSTTTKFKPKESWTSLWRTKTTRDTGRLMVSIKELWITQLISNSLSPWNLRT